jgi:phosphoribosylanthranilate isomerase
MADFKICGVKTQDAAETAIAGGARFLGFMFFPKSPRHVSIPHAASLANAVRGRTEIVAVTVDAPDSFLAAIAAELQPDWIQLHGKESPSRTAEARRFAGKGVIKVLPIARAEDFAAEAPYADVADMLMYDAKAPEGAALPGGNGAAFDWTLLNGRSPPRPWFLAGGLTAENVREAVAASGARFVDVSSGVESAPGVKDRDRISQFARAAKAA